jgi:hypothetical protein
VVEYVVVVADADAVDEVSGALGTLQDASPEVAEIQGLGGSLDAWILAGTAVAQLIPGILKAIYPFVEARRIKSVKAGDVEIMNPRPEDVTKVLDRYFASESTPQPGADG